MEKQSRWQLWLITLVFMWSLYSLAPSIFYYFQPLSPPLHQNLTEREALRIANNWPSNAMGRYDGYYDLMASRQETLTLLQKYFATIQVLPEAISFADESSDDLIQVQLSNSADARYLSQCISKASANAAYAGMKFIPLPMANDHQRIVYIQRALSPSAYSNQQGRIPVRYLSLYDKEGNETAQFKELAEEQKSLLLRSIQDYRPASAIPFQTLWESKIPLEDSSFPAFLDEARRIHSLIDVLGLDHTIALRLCASSTIGSPSFQQILQKVFKSLLAEKSSLEKQQAALKTQNQFLSEDAAGKLTQINSDVALLQKLSESFQLLSNSYTIAPNLSDVASSRQAEAIQSHPYLAAISFDHQVGKFYLHLHPDISALINSSQISYQRDLLQRSLIDYANLISGISGYSLTLDQKSNTSAGGHFSVAVYQTPGCSSLLMFDLDTLTTKELQLILSRLKMLWKPVHRELQTSLFQLYDYKDYQEQAAQDQAFCLFTYKNGNRALNSSFEIGNTYVIIRGLQQILEKYSQSSSSEWRLLEEEAGHLFQLLSAYGYHLRGTGEQFKGPGLTLSAKDLVFEKAKPYQIVLEGTREKFFAYPKSGFALLELTNMKDRIHVDNQIANQIQADLLATRNQFEAAKVSLNTLDKLYHFPPLRSPLWNNLVISWNKFFHGDERKILKWGLDLSGGKVVQIALRDEQQRLITSPDALAKAKGELTRRLNRLGVSEIAIRQEGSGLTLEFPGSQHLSARELIKASELRFHILNEKFAPANLRQDGLYAKEAQSFLDEVWSIACTQGRTDGRSLTSIAGQLLNQASVTQSNSAAKTLYDAGLRFPSSQDSLPSASLNQELSAVAPFRESNESRNPLAIIFYNYAFEGGSLEEVNITRDQIEGYGLAFRIKDKNILSTGEITSPQESLYSWSSQYSQEKITTTLNQKATNGQGWRMAILLDGEIISAPVLQAALKDRASITGRFSQETAQQLANDLKAGSLSFHPEILSEMNISAELGSSDREQGVLAATLGLVSIIAVMCYYYRTSGLIASIALIFNILIIAAALQSLEAAITLPGIAAVVLTLGMAVDANVLVFERLREELTTGKRFIVALKVSYRRAFSAIFDSNLTTLLAAFILLQFDAGPVKGLALTLIIGLVSSMFTSLLVTNTLFHLAISNFGMSGVSFRPLLTSTKLRFLKHFSKVSYAAAAIALAGLLIFSTEGKKLLSLEFTGGYAVNLFLAPSQDIAYQDKVSEVLNSNGMTKQIAQVRQLNRENYLRVEFTPELESLISPETPHTLSPKEGCQWLIKLLNDHGIQLEQTTAEALTAHWTQIGGQFSSQMGQNAIWGLVAAFASILIYLAVRFELSYALSALLALLHDVIITGSLVGLAIAAKLPIKIDVTTIAALLTIIGYSLNNTIVIFDRVREDRSKMAKKVPEAAFEEALNSTLSRTVLTTVTTQVALLALLVFGGMSILPFSFTMLIGTVVGTVSSLFLAPALALRLTR
jgi:SecD/SecF fusion protein